MITITPGTLADHTGLWLGALKPAPTHSPKDDPKVAARLWLRRAKANPATIDTLRSFSVWSCRDTDIPFWQAVSAELTGSNGNTPEQAPAPVVTQEAPAHKPTGGLLEIPEQLRSCKFILVGSKSKRAIEPKWQTDRNYTHDDPHLLKHIAGGGNYGVVVSGGICVLDADDPQTLAETGALSPLIGTYMVRTGRDGGGAHLYFRCPELPAEKHTLIHPTTGANLGDLRGSGSPFYVVGPGSIHPDTGRPYEPVDPDAEIVTVPLEIVQEIISVLRKPEQPATAPGKPKPSVRGRSISDELGLRPEMFLVPENHRTRDGEIEGAHPIHGSSTGNNLTISPDGTWYCRRCLSGGGALEALAVAEGIIDCADAKAGCLDDHWPEVMKALEKRGYGPKLIEKRVEKAAERAARDEKNGDRIGDYAIDIGIPLPDPEVPSLVERWASTDIGNSDRLIRQYGRDLLYSAPEKIWYIWDGTRFRIDDTLVIQALSRRVALTIYREADRAIYEHEKARLAKWAIVSSSQSRIKAMIESAAPLKAVKPVDLDAHPWLLNCENGTIDLKTGAFREARREDRLTKCAGVSYDRYADCPLWLAHLNMIYAGDVEYIRAIQEFLGYSLIDGNPEQIMGLFYGFGKNGKSVTLATIARILGDYAVTLSADSLSVKRTDNPDAARSDIAALKGARLAIANEGERGAVLAESMIKQLTGDDKIRVRRQHERSFEFQPGFSTIMITNHKPEIKGTDLAIWRRLVLFPHDVVIDEKDRDPHILDKLTAEGPGILNWLLVGLSRYMKRGRLELPEKVKAATDAYRLDQDVLGDFIREEFTVDANGSVGRVELYMLYKQYCDREGEPIISNKRVALYLRERSFDDGWSGKKRLWRGLRIKTPAEHERYQNEGDHQEGLVRKCTKTKTPI